VQRDGRPLKQRTLNSDTVATDESHLHVAPWGGSQPAHCLTGHRRAGPRRPSARRDPGRRRLLQGAGALQARAPSQDHRRLCGRGSRRHWFGARDFFSAHQPHQDSIRVADQPAGAVLSGRESGGSAAGGRCDGGYRRPRQWRLDRGTRRSMRRVSSLRGCHRQRRAASLTRQALCAHPPTFGDDLKHLNLGERDHARLCVWNWCVGSQPCYSIAAFSLAAALRLAMGRRRGRCAISICGSGSAAGIVLFCARLFVPAGLGSAQARHDAISAHLSLIFLARRDLLRAHVQPYWYNS